MKTKIFISGSSGFIGFHVAKKYLDKGLKVHGLDSMNNYYDIKLKKSRLKILKKYKNFSFLKANIENQKKLNSCIGKFKPSIIIHLAAQPGVRYSLKNPRVYLNSNIVGSLNIMEAARKFKVKHLIMGSSSSVYGNNSCVPFKETDIVDFPISPYAYSKKSNELQIHTFHKLYKIDAICMRFFTVFCSNMS